MTGSIRQIAIGIDDYSAFIDSSIASIDSIGFVYTKVCFLKNLSRIKDVVASFKQFKKYCPYKDIHQTELKLRKLTKVLFVYGILGSAVNSLLSLYGELEVCVRPNERVKLRDPCGFPFRCYFAFDVVNFSKVYWLLFILQTSTTLVIADTLLLVTVLLVGVLMHTITQLRNCQKLIYELGAPKSGDWKEESRRIVEYHVKIIEFSKNANEAFGSLLIFHLTVTSFVISILCFNIVILTKLADRIRFAFHVFGWLTLLALICHYGQKLIDESENVGKVAYSIKWYNKTPPEQKDIKLVIIRSQRPITLTALNFGIMSYVTFLQVMRTAYSYFNLFFNLKYHNR